VGVVWSRDSQGHYQIGLPRPNGQMERLMLGAWWVEAAMDGVLPKLPIVNCQPPASSDQGDGEMVSEIQLMATKRALAKCGLEVQASRDAQVLNCTVSIPDRALTAPYLISSVELCWNTGEEYRLACGAAPGEAASSFPKCIYSITVEHPPLSMESVNLTVNWASHLKMKATNIEHRISDDDVVGYSAKDGSRR